MSRKVSDNFTFFRRAKIAKFVDSTIISPDSSPTPQEKMFGVVFANFTFLRLAATFKLIFFSGLCSFPNPEERKKGKTLRYFLYFVDSAKFDPPSPSPSPPKVMPGRVSLTVDKFFSAPWNRLAFLLSCFIWK